MKHCILPPHLVERLARSLPPFRASLVVDAGIRALRDVTSIADEGDVTVYDAKNTVNLPGQEVEGDVPAEAKHVRAHASAMQALIGNPIPKTTLPPLVVNYGTVYPNAFFDGRYLVFGEGDGQVFGDFSVPVEVFAHEAAHKIIDNGPKLEYASQPGALNEHIADVVGVCVKLHASKGEGDWRIGAGLFLDKGPALRDMAQPGTAYDDDLLGKDPQVGHMDAYVNTLGDNGGVHINSGIPNRAFVVFCETLGAEPWTTPLKVWMDAMVKADKTTTFAEFAGLTLNAAAGDESAHKAVVEGWKAVGVTAASEAGQ